MQPESPLSPPPEPCCETAFRGIVEDCLFSTDASLALFLNSDAPDGPHKTRVALRRLTTCLDAFAPILRRKLRGALRDDAKRMFRDLGQVRDSDVYTLDRREDPGHEVRSQRNQKLRDQTRKRLRRHKAVAVAPRALRLVQPGGEIYRTTEAALALRAGPLPSFAAGVLDQAWNRCLGYGTSAAAIPPADRHDFRKDMKTLRYLCEFFDDLFPGLAEDPFASDFRRIQNALGTVNDYEVALAMERRKPPRSLPPEQAEALALADALWARLSAAAPPWRG
ncbi:CHAD domain-containing protein [Pseudogemmobacter blasticus]|uniref:CHAD domain-containing protein n=1 Tax=Fuscovulum blasticum TaxID=1075 RepID=UPI0015E72CFA|nr:CHAD domain-containing protein [Fuscovulum blasticum]